MRRCVRCWEKYGYLQMCGPWIFQRYPVRALGPCPDGLLVAVELRNVLLRAVVEGAPGDRRALSEPIKHLMRTHAPQLASRGEPCARRVAS